MLLNLSIMGYEALPVQIVTSGVHPTKCLAVSIVLMSTFLWTFAASIPHLYGIRERSLFIKKCQTTEAFESVVGAKMELNPFSIVVLPKGTAYGACPRLAIMLRDNSRPNAVVGLLGIG
jgi:hypothetical protein